MAEFTEEQVKEITKAAELIVEDLDESFRIEDQTSMVADAGTNNLPFGQIDPGRAMVMNHLSGYNDVSACTRIRLGYYNRHRNVWVRTVPAPLVTETVEFNGKIRLYEGMYPIVRFEGCTADDDLYATLNGHWIKLR